MAGGAFRGGVTGGEAILFNLEDRLLRLAIPERQRDNSRAMRINGFIKRNSF
jgi:hypothetical protein